MPNLILASVGKAPKGWIAEGINEYQERLKGAFSIEWHFFKQDEQLTPFVKKQREKILLDPKGKLMTSEEFTTFFYQALERGGSTLTFVIGGANGLPSELKKEGQLISLSPLTFTHQMAPLILLEQIYRATEIDRGSPYHK